MPRIDEMPQYTARLPKSTHDLSHTFGFTATCAHLLPVFHDLLQPGEKVRLGFNFNLRTQPLQSAAMEELDVHTEYFFVPMNLLFEPFGNIYFQINDNYSSRFPTDGLSVLGSNFPVWDYSSVLRWLNNNRSVRSYSQNGVALGESIGQMAYRLLDMFGFNPKFMFTSQPDSQWNPNVFPFQFLAYQCIYQYYYRLDNREKFNHNIFNWDRFYNDLTVPFADILDMHDLFRLNYRPLSSDYFSDVKVSPIVDVLNLNANPSVLEVATQWLTRNSFTSSSENSVNVLQSGFVGSNSGVDDASVSPLQPTRTRRDSVATNFGFTASSRSSSLSLINGLDINTANIRAMFANEKLWSVIGRAKKHYDDQVLAHFGFNVPHDVKHEISCFGHDVSQIHIGEVISTAATIDAPLGEIAGKGYGRQNSKEHDFTAPCHGVVMVIFSVVPRYRYCDTMLKINSLTNRQDIPIPEYDHLGMQPLFRYETNISTIGSERSDIMGWQYRYEQYKRRFNRVTQAFSLGGSLNSWMLHMNAYRTNQVNLANTSSFADFVYLPFDLNSIFLVNYPTSWSNEWTTNPQQMYDYDPFVVDSYISCKKMSWMSDYSLPRLDA